MTLNFSTIKYQLKYDLLSLRTAECIENIEYTYLKQPVVYQGKGFDYPIKIRAKRICTGVNINQKAFTAKNKYEIKNEHLSGLATIDLIKTHNREQTNLPENQYAIYNKKHYTILPPEENNYNVVESLMKREETLEVTLVYADDYYYDSLINQLSLNNKPGFGHIGRKVFTMLSKPPNEYDNEVMLTFKPNSLSESKTDVTIKCDYEGLENPMRYIFRQVDIDDMFPARQPGANWNNVYAKNYIKNMKNKKENGDLYKSGIERFVIELDNNSIKEIKAYNKTNDYYNLKYDGIKNKFIHNNPHIFTLIPSDF